MAIKLTTPKSEQYMQLMNQKHTVERLIIRNLSILGEKCVAKIRERSEDESWIDQTGNLRSSIGYVVVNKGRIVEISGFETVKDGADGAKAGRNYAEKLASRSKEQFVLYVVAGMSYAVYVEARDNKDVLASTELWARKEAKRMFDKLEHKLNENGYRHKG